MKSREAGEVSSGCLSAGLWRLQGQHGKNLVGSDSSLCVSFVSRQLPLRNETVTVEKLLNSCLQYVYVLPGLRQSWRFIKIVTARQCFSVHWSALALEYLALFAISTPGSLKRFSTSRFCFTLCSFVTLQSVLPLEFCEELPFAGW